MTAAALAIETTTRRGAVTLGRGDDLLAVADLTQQRRHNVELMPAIDGLCRSHGLAPRDLQHLYLSLGPGSFTGLRVALATAKMLALAAGVKLVGVPTLDVLARNAPDDARRVAVCLNLKRDTVYCALFDANRRLAAEPALRTADELLALEPDAVLGDPLPPLADRVRVLPADLAVPRSEHVYALGRALAAQNAWADPDTIAPLYIREPEAVTLWNERHGPERR